MHCIFLISLLVIQYSPANIVGSFNELLVLLLICKSLCIKASTKCIFLVGISEEKQGSKQEMEFASEGLYSPSEYEKYSTWLMWSTFHDGWKHFFGLQNLDHHSLPL